MTRKYLFIILISFISLLSACGSSGGGSDDKVLVSAPGSTVTSSRFHVFGHSLFTYWGGTPYTNVGDWLGLLAGASGLESVGSHRFGQYAGWNALNWGNPASIGFNDLFEQGNTSPFSGNLTNSNYTHFYTMPSNFLTTDMGGPPYNQPITTAQGELETLIDNINSLPSTVEHILYTHWGRAGSYSVSSSNSRPDFTIYNNAQMGDYLDWHIELQDAVIGGGRPIRMFPVGPIIAWLFENESYLQSLNFYDVYGDSAPHGSENIYLLAALVVYQSIYQASPNLSNFTIPSAATQIRPEIANNLPSIVAAIQGRLDFHNASGVNVWPD